MADDIATPVAEATPATLEPHPTDTASLSDHEAVFGPPDPSLEGDAKVKNDEARAKGRHRAKSQEAGPQDVGRIGELSGEDHFQGDQPIEARVSRLPNLAHSTPAKQLSNFVSPDVF